MLNLRTFQLYIVKEYQRLKEQESNPLSLEWNAKRILSKTNYTLHTDAIKNVIIPKMDIKDIKQGIIGQFNIEVQFVKSVNYTFEQSL